MKEAIDQKGVRFETGYCSFSLFCKAEMRDLRKTASQKMKKSRNKSRIISFLPQASPRNHIFYSLNSKKAGVSPMSHPDDQGSNLEEVFIRELFIIFIYFFYAVGMSIDDVRGV